MKNIIVALFAAASLLVAAPLPAIAGIDVAAACDGDVPESWQRPGGFCDQNDFNRSLTDPSNSESCEPITLTMLGDDEAIRMLVASQGPTNCCLDQVDYKFNPSTGRVIVAALPCGYDCGSLLNDPGLLDDARDRIMLVAC